MRSELSMTSRAEITSKYARAYAKAAKKDKGRILDEAVGVTGWSRDNARRRLTAAASRSPGSGRQVAKRPRKQRSPKYSYDALKVLQKVWEASGGQCGKYLAESMRLQLDLLEHHGELVDGTDRYSPGVREELLSMSAASIDRYLAPAKATDQIRGTSTTKPSPLLRSSIKIRKAGDEVEAEPGFFEVDTVAHCGPTLKGEFARTLNLTCVHRVGVHPQHPQQCPRPHPRRDDRRGRRDPVRGQRPGFRQWQRVPQQGRDQVGRRTGDLLHPRAAAQEERPGHHRVQERAPGAQVRLLLPLRHRRGTHRAEPAVATRQRPAQLPDPAQEARRLRQRPQRQPHPHLRPAPDPAGPATGRPSALTGPGSRADRLPRGPQPRPDRPRDRRAPDPSTPTGQGQDRTTLPRHHPRRPARHPQRHPDQGILTPSLRGHSYVRHGEDFAGILT